MLRFSVDLQGWKAWPDTYTVAYIMPFLEALIKANTVYLKANPGTPSILDPVSGVRYQRERGTEVWRDIPSILLHRGGDCEDLACALAAELRCKGLPARVVLTAITRQSGGRLFHVKVAVGSRRIDPSKMLGMKGEALCPITVV